MLGNNYLNAADDLEKKFWFRSWLHIFFMIFVALDFECLVEMNFTNLKSV